MTKTVEVVQMFEVTIPDNQIEEILSDYREVIDSEAEIEDLFEQIAYNEALGGGFCEGIGKPGDAFIVVDCGIETEIIE